MTQPALIAILAVAACTGGGGATPPAGSDDASPTSGDTVRVEVSARQVEPAPAEGPPAAPAPAGTTAAGEAGRIVVHGRIETPDPCRRITAAATRRGAELTLRVEAHREGDVCAQVIAAFAYDAVVQGLAPGTYRLRVLHAYPGSGWDAQTALEESVTVR